MFVVIEHLLPSLDHLVAHILDLCHSLHKDTQKNTWSALESPYHSPLDVKTASPAIKDLHHHELASDKKPVEGGGMYAPCISASGCRFCSQGATVDPYSLWASP